VNFRRPSSRWALWVFAAALLLKAAMPLLASASAQAQGKALVEICTVYGVKTGHSNSDENPAPDHATTHGGDHCTLNALSVLASSQPPRLMPIAVLAYGALVTRQMPASPLRDAPARWFALLKHGPPTFA
jgi:hypothetical protein